MAKLKEIFSSSIFSNRLIVKSNFNHWGKQIKQNKRILKVWLHSIPISDYAIFEQLSSVQCGYSFMSVTIWVQC